MEISTAWQVGLAVWEVDVQSTPPVWEVDLAVWEVRATRLGGQPHPSGRSTPPVGEVNSTRRGGQLRPSGRSTPPVCANRLVGMRGPSGTHSSRRSWLGNCCC
eukprot:COSAG01_NODE_536_length_15768_cov_58.648286_9_plen_103_part_00